MQCEDDSEPCVLLSYRVMCLQKEFSHWTLFFLSEKLQCRIIQYWHTHCGYPATLIPVLFVCRIGVLLTKRLTKRDGVRDGVTVL